MATPAVGWATAGSSLVLRTTDGGAHWTDVSPPPAPRPHYTGFMQVLGPDTAVVTEEPGTSTLPNTAVLLAITVDGGRTWRTAALPGAARAYDLAWFANGQDGWVSSSGRKGYALYSTTDGGRRWTLRADTVPGAAVGSGGLPASDTGAVTLSFANSRVGWTLGASAAAGGSVRWWLYATRDGGHIWIPVQLPVPAALQPYGPPQPELPHCFSASACVLTAGFGTNRTVVYTSADGGRDWQPAPAPPAARSAALQAVVRYAQWRYALARRDPGFPGLLPPILLDVRAQAAYWRAALQRGEASAGAGGGAWQDYALVRAGWPATGGTDPAVVVRAALTAAVTGKTPLVQALRDAEDTLNRAVVAARRETPIASSASGSGVG